MRVVLLCIACFILGSWVGMLLAALVVVASRAEDRENDLR